MAEGFAPSGHELLFANPLLLFVLEDAAALNAQLIGDIAAVQSASAGLARSNRHGWHSASDLFQRPEPGIARLCAMLRQAVDSSTLRIAPGSDLGALNLEAEGWINVNPAGGYNAPHDHPGWFWSGVYYVAVPPPLPDDPTGGCIEFLDGRTNMRVLSAIDAPCFHSKVTLRPEAGRLLLFPSSLRHWVYPHQGQGERISIAFNARYQRKLSGT